MPPGEDNANVRAFLRIMSVKAMVPTRGVFALPAAPINGDGTFAQAGSLFHVSREGRTEEQLRVWR
jgi:hypothetical protein